MLMPQRSELKQEVRRILCPKGATVRPPDVEMQAREGDWLEATAAEFFDRKLYSGSGSPTGTRGGGW